MLQNAMDMSYYLLMVLSYSKDGSRLLINVSVFDEWVFL